MCVVLGAHRATREWKPAVVVVVAAVVVVVVVVQLQGLCWRMGGQDVLGVEGTCPSCSVYVGVGGCGGCKGWGCRQRRGHVSRPCALHPVPVVHGRAVLRLSGHSAPQFLVCFARRRCRVPVQEFQKHPVSYGPDVEADRMLLIKVGRRAGWGREVRGTTKCILLGKRL